MYEIISGDGKYRVVVDPPSGWLYGFPAPLMSDYSRQLKEAGYPEKDIPFAVKNSRYWNEKISS